MKVRTVGRVFHDGHPLPRLAQAFVTSMVVYEKYDGLAQEYTHELGQVVEPLPNDVYRTTCLSGVKTA